MNQNINFEDIRNKLLETYNSVIDKLQKTPELDNLVNNSNRTSLINELNMRKERIK